MSTPPSGTPRKWSPVKRALIVFGVLGVVLALVWGIVALSSSSSTVTTPVSPATTTSAPAPTQSGTGAAQNNPAPAGCQRTVQLAENWQNRLDGYGLPEDMTEEEFRQDSLLFNGHEPRSLMASYNATPGLGKGFPGNGEVIDPVESVEQLVDGDVKNGACFSKHGIAVYDKWAAKFKDALITKKFEVTYDAINTGINENGDLTQSHGVTGDKSGFDVEFLDADGNVIDGYSVLDRCKNVTTGEVLANVPLGRTDETPAGPIYTVTVKHVSYEVPPCVPGAPECPLPPAPCIPGNPECPLPPTPCVPGAPECPLPPVPCIPGSPECPVPPVPCEETGTCPTPPCEETGTCPPPPCEETGTCPPPPCEETGTCPVPPCEETNTCPAPPVKCPDGTTTTTTCGPNNNPQVPDENEGQDTDPTPGHDPNETEQHQEDQGDPCANGGCGHNPTDSGGGAEDNPNADGEEIPTNDQHNTDDTQDDATSGDVAPGGDNGDPLSDLDI